MPELRSGRLLAAMLCLASLASRAAGQGTEYLFAHFTGNGEDGLHFAASTDALHWNAVGGGKAFFGPMVGSKLMRDPCVFHGPDGLYHLVWTTGWWDKGIGIAHSPDLVHWSEQQYLPVMEAEDNAQNAWAPEITYDSTTADYVIFWSTTIPGRFPSTDSSSEAGPHGRLNHRIYFVTTKDFKTYTFARLLYDPGFSVIDATLVHDGARWVMVMKDETRYPQPKKQLRIATSARAAGPYSAASEPISAQWVEGPSVMQVGASWMIYYDEYTRGHYGAIRSADWKNWVGMTDSVSFPPGVRHGTAFVVPNGTIARLNQ